MNDLGIQLNTARYLQMAYGISYSEKEVSLPHPVFLFQNNLEQIDVIVYEVE
jgi:hypothetical protein